VVLSAAGCGPGSRETTVRITHARPAVLEVPPSVRTLAVTSFWCDTDRSGGVGRGLAEDLVELLGDPPGRYDLVVPADLRPQVPPGPLGPDSAQRVASRTGADAVLYGSASVAVSETSAPRPETRGAVRSKDGRGVGRTVTCRVSVRLAMDEAPTGRTLAAVVLTESCRVVDVDPGAGARAARELLRRCAGEFAEMITPSSTDFLVVLEVGEVKMVSRGNALARDGKYAEALRCYVDALAEKPGDAGAAFNAGVMYEKQRRYTRAAAMYDRALRLAPSEKVARARRRVVPRSAGGQRTVVAAPSPGQ